MRGGLGAALRGEVQQPQRLQGPVAQDPPLGDVELDVPKLRRGTYYPESVLSRWSRV